MSHPTPQLFMFLAYQSFILIRVELLDVPRALNKEFEPLKENLSQILLTDHCGVITVFWSPKFVLLKVECETNKMF